MQDGVINILKPPGLTSNDVVYDVRRALSIKRVGHTGTLDPGACGVLPVCIGKATKLFDYLVEKEKEYIAEVIFGVNTDTLDSYGKITARNSKIITKDELLNCIPKFTGDICQIAPMYSAVSVNGERLYKLARRGIEVERKTRKAHIYAIELLDVIAENRFLLKIRCSKGTYIRTLCSDIANEMGTFAYVAFLLRSASGMFTLENSVTLQELCDATACGEENKFITPVYEVLNFMPMVNFSKDEEVYKKLINGACVNSDIKEKLVRVFYENSFIGIGETQSGQLHIKTRF